MAEKYFEAPTSAESIKKLYDKGKEYNQELDLSNTVETNRNFYCGNQWEGLQTEGLKPVVLNIVRTSIQIKAASIMSEDIAMTVRPMGIPGATSKNMQKESAILTDELNRLWEKRKGTTKTRRILTACPVDGDGCWHIFWDNTAPVATVTEEMVSQLNNEEEEKEDLTSAPVEPKSETKANEFSTVQAEGDIDFEQILNTRCFFGNTSDTDVQSQPWILVVSREFTAHVKKRAEEIKGVVVDEIKGSSDDYFDDKQEDRTTILTLYYKDEDTGTIWKAESTDTIMLGEAIDTGLHFYPICWMNWEERLNSYHGYSAVSELVKNQFAINVLATMAVASVTRAAFPTTIYRKDMFPDGWDNGVGSSIGVSGYVENVKDVATVMEGANYGYQVDKLMEFLISTTNTLNGATDATLGSVNPENTSAIIAAQKAATTPLELNRRNLYQFIEDWSRIAIDFMATYYGTRSVAVFNQTTGEEEIIDFDFSSINVAALDIKIDIGGSSYWSEITEIRNLDNLFLKDMISPEIYIELMPETAMPHKQLALQRLKEIEAQKAMMNDPAMQQMDVAMGEPTPEITEQSPIAPTPQDLAGAVQFDRINATVAKAQN